MKLNFKPKQENKLLARDLARGDVFHFPGESGCFMVVCGPHLAPSDYYDVYFASLSGGRIDACTANKIVMRYKAEVILSDEN